MAKNKKDLLNQSMHKKPSDDKIKKVTAVVHAESTSKDSSTYRLELKDVLRQRINEYRRDTGQTMASVVRTAIVEFLDRKGY